MASSTTVELKSNIHVNLTLTERASGQDIYEFVKFVRREAQWNVMENDVKLPLSFDSVLALVYDDENNICGTGTLLRKRANMFWISFIVVAVSHRRCGMGRAIMTALIDQFRSRR